MITNVVEIKQKILRFISERGPSLPVHLTKISELSLTFTSAILSELLADRKLKLSNIRVGTSPLYFIPGQEEKLELFISNLKDPEVEAFKKLKQNKILDDEKQDPVLRVALRSIRDFAVPLKNKDKLYWKYHLLPDEKAIIAISGHSGPVSAIGQERVIGQQIWEDIQKQQLSSENIEELVRKKVEEISNRINEEKKVEEKRVEDNLEIQKIEENTRSISSKRVGEENLVPLKNIAEEIVLESLPNNPPKDSNFGKHILESETVVEAKNSQDSGLAKKTKSTIKKLKKPSLKDLFLREFEKYLSEMGFELLDVLKSDVGKIVAKAHRDREILVIFSDKRKLDEKELLRDLKKYNLPGLEVEVFLRGEPSKKFLEQIDLLGKIRKIQKIEEQ